MNTELPDYVKNILISGAVCGAITSILICIKTVYKTVQQGVKKIGVKQLLSHTLNFFSLALILIASMCNISLHSKIYIITGYLTFMLANACIGNLYKEGWLQFFIGIACPIILTIYMMMLLVYYENKENYFRLNNELNKLKSSIITDVVEK